MSTTPSKTVTSITATPGTASIAPGATQQFTATAVYSDGSTANVSSTASWTVSSASIATINTSGLATAVSPGSATVTAALNGVSGTAALTVTGKTLTQIAVTASTLTIAPGASDQFTATATYSDGSTANVTNSVTWTTGSATVATISASGLASGVAAGTTSITASLNGVTGTGSLTVVAAGGTPTLSQVTLSAAASSTVAGSHDQFTATAVYSNGTTTNVTANATWTVSNTAIATINASGLATAVAAGTTTVTAAYDGVTATSQLTVTSPSVSSITLGPASSTLGVGGTEQFTATAVYSNGSTGNVSGTVTWSVANTADATITSSGLVTAVAPGTTTVTASLNGVTGSTGLTVTAKTVSSIAISPSSASFNLGSSQTFTATATYTDHSTADVTSQVTWSSSNTDVATITTAGVASSVASGQSTISASLAGGSGGATVTATAPLVVNLTAAQKTSIPTFHVDNGRSGLNNNEITLTPANVSQTTFGKLFSLTVDGYVYGEPVVIPNLSINGATHDVVFVATENDSVYAFDANTSGPALWHVSLLQSGESPISDGPIQPVEGVTSTPVVDTSSNTIYVVSMQTSSANGTTYRLNALNLLTGAQKYGGPVTLQASVPGTNSDSVNGTVTLDGSCTQRAALLLANGNIYIGFGSCHSGWLLAYSEQLQPVGVFNASPNLDGEGAYASAGGVWMGGGGPVADSSGNIYITTGNGPWSPSSSAYADSVLKFSPTLTLEDYFTPQDYAYMNCADADLASGGLMMIPNTTQMIAGGKMGKVYMVNSSNLGHESTNDTGATYTIWYDQGTGISPYATSCTDSSGTHNAMINSFEIFGTAAYYNGSVYLGVTPTSANASVVTSVQQFTYSSSANTLSPGLYTVPNIQENTRGTTPFISANNNTTGILWMIDEGQPIQNSGSNTPTPAILRAYSADDLTTKLYESTENASDIPGYGIKFSSPVVVNGKVYISTGHDLSTVTNPQGEIDVYGLH